MGLELLLVQFDYYLKQHHIFITNHNLVNMNLDEREKLRFDQFSNLKINEINNFIDNIERYPEYIKLPYIYFENKIIEYAKEKNSLIDVCCGDGIHTFIASSIVNKIYGIDFSEKSIELCNELKKKKGINNVHFVRDNVLHYNTNKKFDVVIMAGSISYFNHKEILDKLYSLISNNGTLIIIDSLNDNIFYRLNRFLHFLFGKRSYYTIKNMPYLNKLVENINKNYNLISVKNFGIFIFLTPLLKYFFSENKISNLITLLDNKFHFLNRYSFKTVIIAKKHD